LILPPLAVAALIAGTPIQIDQQAVGGTNSPSEASAAATATAMPEDAPAPSADDAGAAKDPGRGDGEIVVSGEKLNTPGDPLERVNAQSFAVVQSVDKAVVGPIAHGYKRVLPKPARDGLHNVLNLLEEPSVFVNDLLQLHPGRAVKTLGRTAINVVLGLGGLFDVAKRKPFNMPFRYNGFENTFGYYGVKPGPYLFLPLIGPTTARDLPGRLMDLSLLSATVGAPFNNRYYGLGHGVIKSVDDRVQIDDDLKRLRDRNEDPYAAIRSDYLKRRQAEIDWLHGRKPVPAAPTPAAPSPSTSPEVPATSS